MNFVRLGVYKQIARHPWIAVVCLFVCLYAIFRPESIRNIGKYLFTGQYESDIGYISEYLDVFIYPPDNFAFAKSGSQATIYVKFGNKGQRQIRYGKWALFFNSLMPVQLENLSCGMSSGHVNGGLYYVMPLRWEFQEIKPGTSLLCQFHLLYGAIARSDFMPNWYVAYTDDRLGSRVISSTADDDLKFVGNFDSPSKWKSHPADNFNPYTPEGRYHLNKIPDNALSRLVIPTPKTLRKVPGRSVTFDTNSWKVLKSDEFPNEAKYLAEKLLISSTNQKPDNKFIELKQSTEMDAEEYHLLVNSAAQSVYITAKSSAGAFYGVQTLLSILAADESTIPPVEIRDKPRFPYRGVMIDVARNFQYKESIMKFIDVIATYKLNKLHLHLTDDEGWRLEIPGLPELVEIGSRRCHQQIHSQCLIPSLGSGPNPTSPGSGFYTVDDYRQILKYANERHVQIIPEIDMPGHARAAIYSMAKREENHRHRDSSISRTSYLLSDDSVSAHSVQNWLGNAINPCLNSTYQFIEKILDTLISLHKDIQKLKIFHFGGDEVIPHAWDNSVICKQLFRRDGVVKSDTLKKLFVHTVAGLAEMKGLTIAAWEDGMYEAERGPFPKKDFGNKDVFVIPWSNVWEAGTGGRAIEFADEGYKVILSLATHLYFDHPYEPDPEERGLHWATRYIDTRKTFGFMPDDIFANADVNKFGIPYNLLDLCKNKVCPKTRLPENVVGIQGCIWGETVRSAKHLHYMAFPRVLALAERAWHKAPWEYIENPDERKLRQQHDWQSFVKTLGDKELPRLEKLSIRYRVPIPGAVLDGDVLHVNTLYPNHDIEASTDGWTWNVIEGETVRMPGRNISLRSKTKNLHRPSRIIHVINDDSSPASNEIKMHSFLYVNMIHLLYIFVIK